MEHERGDSFLFQGYLSTHALDRNNMGLCFETYWEAVSKVLISISLPPLFDWGLKIEGKVGPFMSNMPSKIESGILTLQSSSIIYFGLFSKRNVCDSIPNWFDENQRDRSKNESQFQDNEGRVHWGDCGSTSHTLIWLPSKGLHDTCTFNKDVNQLIIHIWYS